MPNGRTLYLHMDFVFHLDEVGRSAFMRRAVRILRWAYISLWSFDRQTGDLACTDGWYDQEQEAGSSSMTESVGLRLFSAFKLCRFSPPHAGLPGLAFHHVGFLWLTTGDILNFPSVEDQRRFYLGAGIQTVLFIPCENGVIELGTTKPIPADERMAIANLLTEDIFRAMLQREYRPASSSLPVEQSRPSSSSSSLISRSMDSPDSSSLCTLASSYADPHKGADDRETHSFREYPTMSGPSEYYTRLQSYFQLLQSPAQLLAGATASIELPLIGPDQHRPRPPVVQSMGSTSSTTEESPIPEYTYRHTLQGLQSSVNTRPSAFGRWRPLSRLQLQPTSLSQYMLKKCIIILGTIHAERLQSVPGFENPQRGAGASSQVHHMISERRRRLRLNESFKALRSLLPPGSRRDQASILASTRDYLNALKARVEELERRNEQLESSLHGGRPTHAALEDPPAEGGGNGDNSRGQEGGQQTAFANIAERIRVELSEVPSTPTEIEISCAILQIDPSNATTDLVVALVGCIRELNLNLISFTFQKEASQYRSTLRISKTEEAATWDAQKWKEVKDAILSALVDASR